MTSSKSAEDVPFDDRHLMKKITRQAQMKKTVTWVMGEVVIVAIIFGCVTLTGAIDDIQGTATSDINTLATAQQQTVEAGVGGTATSFAISKQGTATADADADPTATSIPTQTQTPTQTPTPTPEVRVEDFEVLAEFNWLSAEVSPDGSLLAWGSQNGAIHIIDLDTYEEIIVLEKVVGDADSVPLGGCQGLNIAWLPDGSKLAAGWGWCKDHTPNDLWDTTSWEQVEEPFEVGFGGEWSPNTRLLAYSNLNGAEIRIVDTSSMETVALLEGRYYWASWSPDGSNLITGGDNSLHIWDTSAWEELGVIEDRDIPTRGFLQAALIHSWSPDGAWFVLANSIWDISNREELVLTEEDFLMAAWSADSTRLATITEYRSESEGTRHVVRIWDVNSWEALTMEEISMNRVNFGSLIWLPGGRHLAVFSSMDTHMFIWDASSGELVAQLDSSKGRIDAVFWNADGTRVILIDNYGVSVWGLPGQ